MPRATEDDLPAIFNRLKDAKEIVYDAETSGLDFKRNHIVGHVVSFDCNPSNSFYLPARHLGRANLFGRSGPATKFDWDGKTEAWEDELIKLLNRPDLTIIGQNLAFDLKFLHRVGHNLRAKYQDTIINAPLLNEWSPKFGLEYLANEAGLTPKKTALIEAYILANFPDCKNSTNDKPMAHFWRLAGDDATAIEYACGDGVTTFELRDWQLPRLAAEDLMQVWAVENRLIPVLARMSIRGIRIDEDYLNRLQSHTEHKIDELSDALPEGFNARSPVEMEKYCRDAGVTNWPKTPTGRPSFPENWLESFEAGQKIVQLRKLMTLLSMFIVPLKETHIFNGRVHTTFNQLRGDDFGVVTGRIACLAGDTRVLVPSITKAIKDVRVGDLVYSYDDMKQLTLKKVLWAGKTGHTKLFRVHYLTQGSRRKGFIDVTATHEIRLTTGEYVAVKDLKGATLTRVRSRKRPNYGQLTYQGGEHVLACSRETKAVGAMPKDLTKTNLRNYLYVTGIKSAQRENRLAFKIFYGHTAAHIHHKDENQLNDDPRNLEALTASEHGILHATNTPAETLRQRANKLAYDPEIRERQKIATRIAAKARRDAHFAPGEVEQAIATAGSIKAAAQQLNCDPCTIFERGFRNPRKTQCNLTEKELSEAYHKYGSRAKLAKALGFSYMAVRTLEQKIAFRKPTPRALTELFNNHMITHIEALPGTHDVYDLTVEDTHNFIANEICVHNCSDPSLQQIPKRDKKLGPLFRACFIPDDGMIFADPDYSQLEPRLLAYYSRSKVLLNDYRNNPDADAHQAVADAAGIERTWGKNANMTIINGGGRGVLIAKYHVPADKVDGLLKDYFETMPEVRTLQKRSEKIMRYRGYVISLLGRRSRVLDPGKAYMAINRLLQCGNADITKLKMCEIDDYLETQGRPLEVLNTVHDALLMQYRPEAAHHYQKCLEIMIQCGPGDEIALDVPLKVNSSEGEDWSIATYGDDVRPMINEVKAFDPSARAPRIRRDIWAELAA
jgi:DNA polymerase I-like protein with 3'-5' exonuclease and polymerase domains